MEDIKFLKFFVLSIMNLLSYLLSIFFLVSLFYTKLLSFYFINDENNLFNKYYNDIAISFSFHTIFFLAFYICLFIIIFRNKPDSDEENKEEKCDKVIMIVSLILYLVCQFFYLLDIILMSVNLKKIKNANIECILKRDEFNKQIYKNSLIIGYIFFAIFLVFSIWAFMFTEEKFNFLRKLNDCNFLENYFNKFIQNTPEKLQKENEKLNDDIRKLREKLSGSKNHSLNCHLNQDINEFNNEKSDIRRLKKGELEENNMNSMNYQNQNEETKSYNENIYDEESNY